MVGILVAVATARLQEPLITFESPGVTIAEFCKVLSSQTGKSFQAWDEARQELLAIRLDHAPLSQVLEKLSKTDLLKIQEEDGSTSVRPDQLGRQKLRDEELAQRIARIKASQLSMERVLKAHPFDNAEADNLVSTLNDLKQKEDTANNQTTSVNYWVQAEHETMRTPSGRVMQLIYTSIPPEELAAIPPDSEGVWSTYPTAVERPTPVDPQALLAQFNRESLIWEDHFAHLHVHSSGMGSAVHTDTNPIKVLRLSISEGTEPILVLSGYDAAGNRAFEAVTSVMPDKVVDAAKKQTSIDTPEPKSPDFALLSPTLLHEINMWSGYPGERLLSQYAQDPELVKRFFEPEKVDPIAETLGNAMLALAKFDHVQLIAQDKVELSRYLPEKLVTSKGLNLSYLRDTLRHDFSWTGGPVLSFQEADGWMTLSSTGPMSAERMEFSRPALGALYRTARDRKNLTIMDVARFAASSDSYWMPQIRSMDFLGSAVPDLQGGSLIGDGEWPLKTFLGRLTDQQISEAQQPDGLALARCTADQLAPIWMALRFDQLRVNGHTDVWQSNPTDGIPRGLPGGGVLHLSVGRETAYQVDIGELGGRLDARGWYYTGPELADRLTRKPGREKYNSYNLLKITPQASENYIFKFQFPGDTEVEKVLHDYRAAAKPSASINGLAEPYRSELLDLLKKAAG